MTRSKAQSAKRGRVRAQGDKAPGADAGKGVESVLNHSQRQTLKPELGDLPAAKRLRAPEVWSAPYSTRPHQGAAQGMQTPYAFNSTAYAAGSSVPAHYHAWLPFNMSPVWPPAYAMYPPQGYSFSPYHHQYMARFGYSPLLAQDRAHTSTISAAAIPANSSTAGLSPSLGADSPPYPQDSSRSRVDLAVAAAMASFGAPATTDSSQLATQAI